MSATLILGYQEVAILYRSQTWWERWGITKMRGCKEVNLGDAGASMHGIWKSQHLFALCILIFFQISSFCFKNTPIKQCQVMKTKRSDLKMKTSDLDDYHRLSLILHFFMMQQFTQCNNYGATIIMVGMPTRLLFYFTTQETQQSAQCNNYQDVEYPTIYTTQQSSRGGQELMSSSSSTLTFPFCCFCSVTALFISVAEISVAGDKATRTSSSGGDDVLFTSVSTIADYIFAFCWQIFKICCFIISSVYSCCIFALAEFDMDCIIHVNMPCPAMDRKPTSGLWRPNNFIVAEFSLVLVLLWMLNFVAILCAISSSFLINFNFLF